MLVALSPPTAATLAAVAAAGQEATEEEACHEAGAACGNKAVNHLCRAKQDGSGWL